MAVHFKSGAESLTCVIGDQCQLTIDNVTAVRALIKQLVAAEDGSKPLSDSQLSAMLEEQGIQVARRTVAKYREALKIAPANLRKSL